MLKASSVSKHFDTETLFSDVHFVLGAGDRTGLVGPNGAGKSTLLRILVGQEKPSTGQVILGPGTTVGFFGEHLSDLDTTVGAYLREGLGEVASLADRMVALEKDQDLAEYGEVLDRWTTLEGWTAAHRLAEARGRLDIAHLPDDARLVEVSGGEQARLTLARVLLARPDLLILDEPTNHLDADGIAWLSAWLTDFAGGVLVVSHDRGFLDATVTQIMELDGIHETPQRYEGGYTAYREEKDRRWQRYLLDFEAQEKKRRRWEADIIATKQHALGIETTVRRGPGADTQRRRAKKVARKAKVRERRLQRQLESARWLAHPETRPTLALAFPGDIEECRVVLRTNDLTLAMRDRVLLKDLNLLVRAGERVLLSGANGSGKTTLLRALSGAGEPTAGSVYGADGVQLLPQNHDSLRTGVPVLEYFRSKVPVYIDDAEQLLAAYQFPAEMWDAPLRTLSAGELRRLLLAVMVNSGGQVLLLDEPTNYLDFDSLDVVEEALRAYRGTLIIVTHDGYFADRVGITRRWQVDGAALTESEMPHA